MKVDEKVINKIIAWAQQEEPIRVLLLTGSLAGKGPTDELSDYDIAVFTNDIQKYLNNDAWMEMVGNVLVYEPCEHQKNGKIYPTRLIIYQDGLQVDFAFFDLAYLQQLKQQALLPVEYNLGYKVLLDKDDLSKDLPLPTYSYPYTQRPSQASFDLVTRIFFFEAFKEAKALVRRDLWHAKIRDWSTKKRLLCMIEWHTKAINGWNYDANVDAKRMQSWVDPVIWQKVHDVFSSFDAQASWKALFATLDLFDKLATETANKMGYTYLNIGSQMLTLIKGIKKKTRHISAGPFFNAS